MDYHLKSADDDCESCQWLNEYKSSSAVEVSKIANALNSACPEFINTKNRIREIKVNTITRMLQNRPLFDCDQISVVCINGISNFTDKVGKNSYMIRMFL